MYIFIYIRDKVSKSPTYGEKVIITPSPVSAEEIRMNAEKLNKKEYFTFESVGALAILAGALYMVYLLFRVMFFWMWWV